MSGNSQTALLGWNRSFGGRLFTTGLLIGLTMPVYMWINHTVAPRFDLGLPVDASIPFLPWTIFVYLSFYLLLLTAAALSTPRDYSRIQKTVLAANFICYAGFFLVPAHYPRPLRRLQELWRESIPGCTPMMRRAIRSPASMQQHRSVLDLA
jgi:hypothetical protein